MGQEQVGLPAVDLPPGQLSPLRSGADVGEHVSSIGRGAVLRDPAGGLYDPGGGLPLALGQLQPGGEGVGLDGAAPRLQVGPVDGGDLLRGGEAGQLATLVGPPGQGGKAGAHGPIEQQGAALPETGSDIRHPSTFFAISTDCLASLA